MPYPKRVGVIGARNMGQNHARVYSEIAELVAVTDINAEFGKAIASESELYFRDFSNLLSSGMEAVTVVAPTKMPYKVTRMSIEKEVHVLVERPLAADLREAKAHVEQAKRECVTIAVGHISNQPSVQCLHKHTG